MQSASTRGQIRGATRGTSSFPPGPYEGVPRPTDSPRPLALSPAPSLPALIGRDWNPGVVPQTGLRPTPFLEGRSEILPLMSCKAFWSQSSLPGACRPSGRFRWTLWAVDANSQGACSLPLAQVKVSLRRLLRLARFSRLRAQRCGLGTQDGCDQSSGILSPILRYSLFL